MGQIEDIMHIYRTEAQELYDNGLMRPMEDDLSFDYQLQRLTKHELDEIRKQLGIKGASNLRKGELVQVLQTAIPQALGHQLSFLDEVLVDALQELLDNQGVVQQPLPVPSAALALLRRMGLAFTGLSEDNGLVLVMPYELWQPCRRWLRDEATKQRIMLNQRILLATRGLLTYYGVLSLADLQTMLESMQLPTTDEYFEPLIFDIGEANGYFGISNDLVHDARLMDIRGMYDNHMSKPQYDYYPVNEDAALFAGQQLYADWTDEHREIFEFFQEEFELDDEEAADALLFFIFAVNNDMPASTMLEHFEVRDLPVGELSQALKVLTVFERAYQQTRLWKNKGYTPTEMQEMESRPRLRLVRPLR